MISNMKNVIEFVDSAMKRPSFITISSHVIILYCHLWYKTFVIVYTDKFVRNDSSVSVTPNLALCTGSLKHSWPSSRGE